MVLGAGVRQDILLLNHLKSLIIELEFQHNGPTLVSTAMTPQSLRAKPN